MERSLTGLASGGPSGPPQTTVRGAIEGLSIALKTHLSMHGSGPVLVLVQSLSSAVFVSCWTFQFPFSEAACAVFGFLSLILLPGIALSNVILPDSVRSLGSTVTIGIATQLLTTHVMFIMTVLTGPRFLLWIWASLSGCVVVYASVFYLRLKSRDFSFDGWRGLPKDRALQMLLVAGLTARLIVFSSTSWSIAPDASLYSDYARSIVRGEFRSSVSNDVAVMSVTEGIDFLAHQAATYLFAISWVLVPPGSIGPTVLLPVVGMALVLEVYLLSRRLFGERTASFTLALAAVQPVLVFYSAVAYGPEILSLLISIVLLRLLLDEPQYDLRRLLLAGTFMALISAVWYTSFYMLCVVALILVPASRKYNREESALFVSSLIMLAILRTLYADAVVFTGIGAVTVIVSWFLARRFRITQLGSLWALPAGTVLGIVFWKWPVQLRLLPLSVSQPASRLPFVDTLLSPLTISAIGNSLAFLAVHISVPLLALLLLVLLTSRTDLVAVRLVISFGVIYAGTTKVLSNIGGLEMAYMYSDSRFFLFMTVIAQMGASVALNALTEGGAMMARVGRTLSVSTRRRIVVLGMIILVGLLPAYLTMPSGIDFVNIEKRYGWAGLSDAIDTLGVEDPAFIVDRARELAWYAGCRSVTLRLRSHYMPEAQALLDVLDIKSRYGATHLLIDAYTVASWKTFFFLYSADIEIGTRFPLDPFPLFESSEEMLLPAVQLVASTEETGYHYVRIFAFSEGRFVRSTVLNLLEDGWYASAGGRILNDTGFTTIVVGNGSHYTNTQRVGGLDLNIPVAGGVLLLSFEEFGARVTRVELWSSTGVMVGHSVSAERELVCFIGNTVIGDMRIVVEGDPGEYVRITQASIWTCSGT
ncbi:MAG: glycosyltransferase family 39 protein [Candidatus Thorarchaeota archaeon]